MTIEAWAESRREAARVAIFGAVPDDKLYHANLAASHVDIRSRDVLVVGCNRGEDCRIFIDLGARHVTGLDVLDEIGIHFVDPRARYIQASAEDMPLPDGVFDLVFAYATLEHVPRPDLAFREMSRVCRRGGAVYSHAAPLWNSRGGPHWGDGLHDLPWAHLRRTLPEIQAFNADSRRPAGAPRFRPPEIDYWLDDRFFSKRWARDYLAAGWSVPGVEVIANRLDAEPDTTLPEHVAQELAPKGYSRMELLSVNHDFIARKL